MKAEAIQVKQFLSADKTRFLIPVYQRNYDWGEEHCKQLLDDILAVGNDDKKEQHFIGSIVYVHEKGVSTTLEIRELTVIDGQQRLTTLTLIYLALYRIAKESGKEERASEIEDTYLTNKYAPGEKLKLRPTKNNDEALKHLLRKVKSDDGEEFPDFSRLVSNFDYFKNRIKEENYKFVRKGLLKLMCVEISLNRENEDAQTIFESLNSTGLELSQADLIRNYILMNLNHDDQEKIYENYWKKIEELAKDESSNKNLVSDYIRDYLTIKNKKIPNKAKVYLEFKAKYSIASVEKLEELEKSLSEIKKLAKYYNKLVNPENEKDREIKLQLDYIKRLETDTVFPFLVKVYDDYGSSTIDKATFLGVLELIQSFIVRRFIVGVPTNALNKIFMSLYDKVEREDYLRSIQKSLLEKSGSWLFPKNQEFIDALKVKNVYKSNKDKTYLLERLEHHKNDKERVKIEGNEDITVEHIFPQNPDLEWKRELGDEQYEIMQEKYLHTIANLTLSGNNGKLGNKTFRKKRDLKEGGYKESRLWLNQYLSSLERWDEEAIEKRFNLISERALEIWEYPEIAELVVTDHDEINLFEADDPTHRKLEYAVFFDEKIEIDNITELYKRVFKYLFELQPETFFTSGLNEKIGLMKKPEELSRSFPLNDTYFIEIGCDSKTKFERMKKALTIFGFEEELSVKYAEDGHDA